MMLKSQRWKRTIPEKKTASPFPPHLNSLPKRELVLSKQNDSNTLSHPQERFFLKELSTPSSP
jgi:hypothetical protein